MKRSLGSSGFTLIEMLTVMLIIAVLAGLILGIYGFANGKASRARAEGEIAAVTAACQAYKGDNGTYPRTSTLTPENAGQTEGPVTGTPPMQTAFPINPKTDGDPTKASYKSASLYLYEQLSGDLNADGKHDDKDVAANNGVAPSAYMTFRPDQLGGVPPGTAPGSVHVLYLQDPFGFSYGYSTTGATDEDCYDQQLKTTATAPRPDLHGFNTTFDMWSTAGRTASPTGAADPNTVWSRWVKNW